MRMGPRDPESAAGLWLDSSSLRSMGCKHLLCLILSLNTYLPNASLGLDPNRCPSLAEVQPLSEEEGHTLARFRVERGWEPLDGRVGFMENRESLLEQRQSEAGQLRAGHSELGRRTSHHALLVA